MLQKQERDSKLNYIINKRKICCTIAATLDQILLPDSAFEPFYCTPFLVLWPVFPGSLMACTTSFRCSLCLQSQTANRVENNCRTRYTPQKFCECTKFGFSVCAIQRLNPRAPVVVFFGLTTLEEIFVKFMDLRLALNPRIQISYRRLISPT